MSSYFSGTYTSTVALTTATQNPATVTATGWIVVASTAASAAGIDGQTGFAWTVANLGTVESVGIGIDLAAGGGVANGTAGSATGCSDAPGTGIMISGTAGESGPVANYGYIKNITTNQNARAVS